MLRPPSPGRPCGDTAPHALWWRRSRSVVQDVRCGRRGFPNPFFLLITPP